jgi:hypothetical protein
VKDKKFVEYVSSGTWLGCIYVCQIAALEFLRIGLSCTAYRAIWTGVRTSVLADVVNLFARSKFVPRMVVS